MKLGIVVMYVHNFEKAKAFYHDVIGLPIELSQTSDKFAFMPLPGGPPLALQDISITSADKAARAGLTEIGFEVDDVDATYSRWKAKGVEIVEAPENKPFGRYFLAKDPEGHLLDVFGPVKR